MGGGPKKSDVDLQRQTAQGQIALGNRLADQSQNLFAQQQQYQAPLVKFLQGVIGGDQNSRISTAAIPLGQIAQGNQQARESILDSIPAGAGRDYALAGLQRDRASQSSALLNQAYLNAFPALANIGTGNAQLGLGQLSGSLGATGGGAAGIGNVNQLAAQQKASTNSLIGGLAGAAGNVASGGLSGALKQSKGYGTNVMS